MTREQRISQLGALTFGHLVTDMFGASFLPLLPMLIVRLETDKPTMGMVAALVGVVVNLIQPLTGGFLHRFRLPWLLLAGPLLAMGYALLGEVRTVPAVTALAIAAALGVGLFHPSALLGAHVASGRREHLGIPIFLSGGAVGVTLGSVLFTQWVAWQGFERLWWLAPPALALLLVTYAATGVMRLDIHQPLPESDGAPAVPMPFLPLLAMASLLAIGNTLLFTYLGMHLMGFMTETEATRWGGIALGVISLGGAAASYLWGAWSRRVGTLRITAAGQVLSAATLLWLLGAQTPSALIWSSLAVGIFSGGSFFPLVAMLGRRAVGFTPGMRAGLSIGGAWFIGSLGVFAAAAVMKLGISATQVMQAVIPLALVNAAYALILHAVQARRERAGARAADMTAVP